MTDVLLILDGASEPVRGDEPTSLERATTPVLDALAGLGTLHRLATTPPGLPAGSETGCATLLGWTPDAPVDRGALEAAGHALPVADGEVARRVDVLTADGSRAAATQVDGAVRAIEDAAPRDETLEVHRIGGHRLLLVGPAETVDAAARSTDPDGGWQLDPWPAGETPPAGTLDDGTTVIAAPGAVLGLAALLGAQVVGIAPQDDEETALAQVAGAALAALDDEPARLVIHWDGADEAAHRRDPEAKALALSRVDGLLLAPIVGVLHEGGGTLTVAIDHGSDPQTGRHGASPTPALRWGLPDELEDEPDPDVSDTGLDADDLPQMALPKRKAGRDAHAGRRLTERWAAPLPVEQPTILTRETRA